MSNVNAEIKWQGNDNQWFTANASTVYPANIQIFHIDGRYKFTDGVTTLSALPFLGGNSYILTDAEIGSVINSAASATPNDTDLVMSVGTSVAKKNTWTQIKAFLKTYFDTLFVKKGTITNNTILKGSSTDTATNSQITDDGTTVKINNKTEITDNDFTLYNTSYINARLDTSDTYGGSLRIYNNLGNLVANITGKDFATYFNTNYSFGIGTATPKSGTKFHVKTNTNQNLLVYEYNGKLTIQAENDAGSAYSSLQFYCDFELPLLTASQIVGTDINKKLVSIPFGTTAGTVLEGDRITQTITNGVTDKAPSEDAVFDALGLKLTATNNLSDLENPLTARNNLKEWDLIITTGNQSTTSNVATNITDLVSPTLTANKLYDFEGHIYASSNYTGGVKFQITIPTGATITACFDGPIGSNSTFQSGIVLASATLTGFSFIQFNGSSMIKVKGQVLLGGTTGTIQFGFASATNTRTSTVNQLGTHITLRQLD